MNIPEEGELLRLDAPQRIHTLLGVLNEYILHIPLSVFKFNIFGQLLE